MTKLILTRGIPASGKTTWAKSWVAEAPDRRARVNRDDLRFAMYGKYWGVDEKAVTKAQHAQVAALLKAGKDVVVDDTNLENKFVSALVLVGVLNGAEIHFENFNISLTDAIDRDLSREKQVGVAVLHKFWDKLDKGYLPHVPAIPVFEPYEHQLGLPGAILVDIDGTLAHMVNRGPYDTSRYADDAVDQDIRRLVNLLAVAGKQIIVMSGRDDAYRGVLRAWLERHEVVVDRIFMRPQGDTRNDAIVKNELYETHIRGNWNVDFVLDDRNRVVEMWRAKGIKVLQVADGDF